MTLREFINSKLDKYAEVIPFDDFTNIVFWTADKFELAKEDANALVMKLIEARNSHVGSQEFSTSPMWPAQETAVPFGKHNPGGLYNPLSSLEASFNAGDVVDVDSDTWRAKFRGIIKAVNVDNTYNVADPQADHLYEKVPAHLIKAPRASASPLAPPQHRRVGDPWGLMDGPGDVGDPKFIREYPGLFHLPRGEEGRAVTNPPDLFYSSLIERIKEKHGAEVAANVTKYLEGEPINPTRELISVLAEYGANRLA